MRITRETMLKIANDAVARKVRASGEILGAYLCGSLLGEDYLLGGAADIDLVLLHAEPVETPREIVRLTDEVHLDIGHHYHRDYREPRALRVHPWLGPTINACKALYDPQHFLDFTQASVRGQFDRADFIFERARRQAETARNIWFSFQTGVEQPQPADIQSYLQSIELSANSIALLSGPPLTERRFLTKFLERAEAIGQNGLYAGLMGLIGAPNLPPGALGEWLGQWKAAYQMLPPEEAPSDLHPDRQFYWTAGFSALLSGTDPRAVLWPLLRTWTAAILHLPAGSPARKDWEGAIHILGLSGNAFAERIQGLDAYLDLIDETLEAWARKNGAWEG